jgi:hypothetical protein
MPFGSDIPTNYTKSLIFFVTWACFDCQSFLKEIFKHTVFVSLVTNFTACSCRMYAISQTQNFIGSKRVVYLSSHGSIHTCLNAVASSSLRIVENLLSWAVLPICCMRFLTHTCDVGLERFIKNLKWAIWESCFWVYLFYWNLPFAIACRFYIRVYFNLEWCC